MAITLTHMTSGVSAENVTTHSITSFTLPANRLGIIFVMSQGGTFPQPTIPNWTAHTSYPHSPRRVTMFTRVVGTDTTEGLTVSFGGDQQQFITHAGCYADANCVITGTAGVDGIVQALGSGDIHQPTINATPTLTALSAFANVNNASLAYINIGYAANDRAVGTEFTLLSSESPDVSTGSILQWKASEATVYGLTGCTGSQDMFIGIAVELNHVATGGVPVAWFLT